MPKRNSGRLYELHGEMKTLREWCKLYGRPTNVVTHRLRGRWSLGDALTLPTHSKDPKKQEVNRGKTEDQT